MQYLKYFTTKKFSYVNLLIQLGYHALGNKLITLYVDPKKRIYLYWSYIIICGCELLYSIYIDFNIRAEYQSRIATIDQGCGAGKK